MPREIMSQKTKFMLQILNMSLNVPASVTIFILTKYWNFLYFPLLS